MPFIRPTHPLDGADRQSKGPNMCQRKFLSWGGIQVRASVITNLPLCVKNPASSYDQGSIKAKTPLIVHNQGISRQTPFFRNALHTANPPAGWGGPAVARSKREPRKIPLLGERIKVRASVTTNLPLCVKNPPSRHDQGSIKAKTPVIVLHQASSRQTLKI